MINLLSPSDKKQLHAARRNTIWVRYNLLIVAILVGINIVLGATALIIQNDKNVNNDKIVTNEKQRDSVYNATLKEADTFRQNLAIAKTILNNETKYSDIMLSITQVIPSSCILGELKLNEQSFGTIPQILSFKCRSQDNAVELKTAMEKTPLVFDKVNIISTISSNTEAANPYPVFVSMSALIKKPIANQGASS